MATINSVDLGTISNENQSKSSGLLFYPLPRQDSDKAKVFDLTGTQRTITIDGVKVSTSKAELVSFITTIEGMQNGQQPSAGWDYVGDLVTTTKKVTIDNFDWRWASADIMRVSYTLTLKEGHL